MGDTKLTFTPHMHQGPFVPKPHPTSSPWHWNGACLPCHWNLSPSWPDRGGPQVGVANAVKLVPQPPNVSPQLTKFEPSFGRGARNAISSKLHASASTIVMHLESSHKPAILWCIFESKGFFLHKPSVCKSPESFALQNPKAWTFMAFSKGFSVINHSSLT